MSGLEASKTVRFRQWFEGKGGRIHPHALLTEAQPGSGYGLIASREIAANEEIVSCPVELVISVAFAQAAVSRLLGDHVSVWTSKQHICTYLSLHQVVDPEDDPGNCLFHRPYVDVLPPNDQLSTPLYFTPKELEHFKGTNIYGVTQERLSEWKQDWIQCREVVEQKNPAWGSKFDWELYLASATYISSRSFPSNLISATPSLPDLSNDHTVTEPILIPGFDALNHSRGHPVTWTTHAPDGLHPSRMSLVVHKPISVGHEVFNNYGPKPNSEFVLSYGFSISDNPDDTIILKLGGINGKKWTIGRNANGVDGLWQEVLETVADAEEIDADPSSNYDAVLDASGALQDMLGTYLERLPDLEAESITTDMRPHVAKMLRDYVKGQSDILHGLVRFSEAKEQEGIALAREAGVELVIED